MIHSTITSKGQTTIPVDVREALGIKPGDRLTYAIDGNQVTLRVHPGARALRGVFTSTKGKGLSFAQIREAAKQSAVAAWNRTR